MAISRNSANAGGETAPKAAPRTTGVVRDYLDGFRAVLRERRIPSNLPHIYKQLGSWTSWGDVWPCANEM